MPIRLGLAFILFFNLVSPAFSSQGEKSAHKSSNEQETYLEELVKPADENEPEPSPTATSVAEPEKKEETAEQKPESAESTEEKEKKEKEFKASLEEHLTKQSGKFLKQYKGKLETALKDSKLSKEAKDKLLEVQTLIETEQKRREAKAYKSPAAEEKPASVQAEKSTPPEKPTIKLQQLTDNGLNYSNNTLSIQDPKKAQAFLNSKDPATKELAHTLGFESLLNEGSPLQVGDNFVAHKDPQTGEVQVSTVEDFKALVKQRQEEIEKFESAKKTLSDSGIELSVTESGELKITPKDNSAFTQNLVQKPELVEALNTVSKGLGNELFAQAIQEKAYVDFSSRDTSRDTTVGELAAQYLRKEIDKAESGAVPQSVSAFSLLPALQTIAYAKQFEDKVGKDNLTSQQSLALAQARSLAYTQIETNPIVDNYSRYQMSQEDRQAIGDRARDARVNIAEQIEKERQTNPDYPPQSLAERERSVEYVMKEIARQFDGDKDTVSMEELMKQATKSATWYINTDMISWSNPLGFSRDNKAIDEFRSRMNYMESLAKGLESQKLNPELSQKIRKLTQDLSNAQAQGYLASSEQLYQDGKRAIFVAGTFVVTAGAGAAFSGARAALGLGTAATTASATAATLTTTQRLVQAGSSLLVRGGVGVVAGGSLGFSGNVLDQYAKIRDDSNRLKAAGGNVEAAFGSAKPKTQIDFSEAVSAGKQGAAIGGALAVAPQRVGQLAGQYLQAQGAMAAADHHTNGDTKQMLSSLIGGELLGKLASVASPASRKVSQLVSSALGKKIETVTPTLPKTEAERIERMNQVLGKHAENPALVKAIDEAHKVGIGEPGKNGELAGYGNYTVTQLKAKLDIVNKAIKEAGITDPELKKKLFTEGVVGVPQSKASERILLDAMIESSDQSGSKKPPTIADDRATLAKLEQQQKELATERMYTRGEAPTIDRAWDHVLEQINETKSRLGENVKQAETQARANFETAKAELDKLQPRTGETPAQTATRLQETFKKVEAAHNELASNIELRRELNPQNTKPSDPKEFAQRAASNAVDSSELEALGRVRENLQTRLTALEDTQAKSRQDLFREKLRTQDEIDTLKRELPKYPDADDLKPIKAAEQRLHQTQAKIDNLDSALPPKPTENQSLLDRVIAQTDHKKSSPFALREHDPNNLPVTQAPEPVTTVKNTPPPAKPSAPRVGAKPLDEKVNTEKLGKELAEVYPMLEGGTEGSTAQSIRALTARVAEADTALANARKEVKAVKQDKGATSPELTEAKAKVTSLETERTGYLQQIQETLDNSTLRVQPGFAPLTPAVRRNGQTILNALADEGLPADAGRVLHVREVQLPDGKTQIVFGLSGAADNPNSLQMNQALQNVAKKLNTGNGGPEFVAADVGARPQELQRILPLDQTTKGKSLPFRDNHNCGEKSTGACSLGTTTAAEGAFWRGTDSHSFQVPLMDGVMYPCPHCVANASRMGTPVQITLPTTTAPVAPKTHNPAQRLLPFEGGATQ